MKNLILLLLLGLFIGNDGSSEGIEKIKKLERYCTHDLPWRCKDGQTCLPLDQVCDTFDTQCPDDEGDELEGCNLFPDSPCKSWHGKRHEHCHQDNSCTLPKYSKSDCRQCDNSDEWRCPDGHCIKKEYKNDGQSDCEDGSDENSNNDSDEDSDIDNDESSTKKPEDIEELNIFTCKIFETKPNLMSTNPILYFRVHFQVVDLVIDGNDYVFFRYICFISSESHMAKSKFSSIVPGKPNSNSLSFVDQFVSLPLL